ncbi:hypothetical protein NQ314_010433, partial [Rhamnusium bicolor]
MTNTRITDIEIVERRYPVHVRKFMLRPGTGGCGRYRGICSIALFICSASYRWRPRRSRTQSSNQGGRQDYQSWAEDCSAGSTR